jgi:ubiquinone/menaquinone biosynthesis C-methylase UbiE
MSNREHWEKVYQTKSETDVSWYQPHLQRSLDLILHTGIGTDARIIDIGGGASTLVDDLLGRGFHHVTVVDIAQAPLDATKKRLGERAKHVNWLVGDVTMLDFPHDAFDLWHDRAVFHFLTSEASRKAYLERVCCSVRKGGHVVLATFGPEGPEKCSGLPVIRYSAEKVHATFGDAFRLVEHLEEHHRTPWGTEHEFVYCLCVRESECERAVTGMD